MKLRRYLIFAYDTYYPLGGMEDCKGSFETLEDARNYYSNSNELKLSDECYIVDLQTGEQLAPVQPSRFNIRHGRIHD